MSGIVNNTADILAILGGVTTFFVGVFAAIRMSRCKQVSCCWNGCTLVNEPPKSKLEATSSVSLTTSQSETDIAGVVV